MTRTKKQTHNGDERAALILELFRQLPDNKFSLRHLASASGGASKEGRRETMQIVEQLLATGVIESCPRDKYRLSPAQRPRLEGTVEMLNTGSMFVHVEGMEQQVYIHSRNSLNALDGDRVQLVLTRKARGSNAPEGEITAIVERSRKRYVGTAEVNEHNVFVRIDSRKMPVDVYLHKRDCPNVKNGDKVVVRIAEWAPGSKSPVGELVDILGKAGENDTEMHAILAEYDLPYRFEPEVEAAAEAIDGRITCKDYAERRDFRQTVTFTVDPADAKDFDDALSVRKIKDGVWEVGVHIADVTHYVRPHSVIDDEAVERGTSVYLVDRTVPMLPERLSNELCSLRPHETSLCFSAVFTLNENLDILEEWFGRTVIHSDRRFTYAEAQEIIETGRGDYAEEVLTLNRLAQALRKERFRNGAISFDREEVKFRLDENGKPLGVYFKEQKESNQMIEEFMLLANRRVAEFCGKRRTESGRSAERTMVYRVHDTPSEEKLDRFRQFILRFGHIFKATKGRAVAKELNKLFKQIKGTTEENAVATMAVRSMAKAYYTTDNIGHYGLAFPYYTHFTSPIRRYPDLLLHRTIKGILSKRSYTPAVEFDDAELMTGYHARKLGSNPEAKPSGAAKPLSRQEAKKAVWTRLGIICSAAERRADDASREVMKFLKCQYLLSADQKSFQAAVTGMCPAGIFVTLSDMPIEGFVHISQLGWGYFVYDPAKQTMTSHEEMTEIRLEDRLTVRLEDVDLKERRINFTLLSNQSRRHPAKGGGRRRFDDDFWY